MSSRYESSTSDASPLGQPLKFEFSGRVAQNRFLKGAMTERQSSWDPKDLPSRGVPSETLVNLYKRWGEGEFGQILTGNIMIEYDHLEAMGNPIIPLEAPFEGKRFEMFSKIAEAGKRHGSLMVGQVGHPGRQVEDRVQKFPISASDVQLKGLLSSLPPMAPPFVYITRKHTNKDNHRKINGNDLCQTARRNPRRYQQHNRQIRPRSRVPRTRRLRWHPTPRSPRVSHRTILVTNHKQKNR